MTGPRTAILLLKMLVSSLPDRPAGYVTDQVAIIVVNSLDGDPIETASILSGIRPDLESKQYRTALLRALTRLAEILNQ